ncbi:MAG TPA: hypothetical protein VHY19_02010 [Steroidobacteraceae bacterium]|jgi:hypothetical protein|nr:hypothetical protein [Steroidobacteraceae bacterium]
MSVTETIKRKILSSLRRVFTPQAQLDNIAFLVGETAARQVQTLESLRDLCETEFRVSSQWGEDGIIEWLVHQLEDIPETFIEFGVEDYRESNTRFLLQHRNWRGLVIDGSQDHVDFIRRDRISWRHDLTAIASFITRDNINSIICDAGFDGEIGILSVDIDGVDYWVWEAIDCISPQIIIVEYNSAFGDLRPLTVPYTPDFMRSRAHHSNLYYGLSIRAARQLAAKRGYMLVGTNRMGSNAFFVRNDRADEILRRIEAPQDRPSRFRESRATNGKLTFTAPGKRTAVVANLPVVDVSTNSQVRLGEAGDLFSPRWQALLAGQLARS